MKHLNAILGVFLMVWLNVSYAGDYETVDFGAYIPTSEELIEALSPPPKLKFRGIVHHGNAGGSSQSWQGLPQPMQSMPQEKPKAVSLQLQFDYNSDNLTSDTKTKLNALASAIQSDTLANYKFVVEGHTCSAGSATYNKELSLRRSQSVIRYMSQQHGIPSSRLQAVGKGMEKPANPSNPKAPTNRRVVIVNAGNL